MRTLRITGLVALAALLPMLMAPTGGFPSRPTFQQVTVTTSPHIRLVNSAAAVDARNTLIRLSPAGELKIHSAADAAPTTGLTELFAAARTGTAWTSLALGNATDNPTYTLLGTGGLSQSASAAAGMAWGLSNTNTGVTAFSELRASNSAHTISMGLCSTGYSGSCTTGAPAGESAYINTPSVPLNIVTTAITVNGIPLQPAHVAFKTSATSRQSTTTLAADPDLSLTFVSTGWYALDAHLTWSCTTSTNQGFKFSWGGSATIAAAGNTALVWATNDGTGQVDGAHRATTATLTYASCVNGQQDVHYTGTINVTATGTLQLFWAQNTSVANNTNLVPGSRIEARKIG